MSSLFSSALNYINAAASSTHQAAAGAAAGGSGPRTDHELVGTNAEIGGLKLRIRYLIAEGGFAHVFAATDASGYWYAIKRLLAADKEAADAVLLEIRFLRQLTGHPAIIQYIQAASLSPQESGHGRAEFLVLTELCRGGQIVDALRRQPFSPYHVCRVFNAACQAVRHMHSKQPPVIHRDLKIENLLLDDHGFVKLCDFGSATTDRFIPDHTWTAGRRTEIEEEMARHTTPMYRSPEMLDLYLDYPIHTALDVWALGCVLYYLCYRTHPFEDSAKLRIINAKYTLPEDETPFTVFHPIIDSCLQIDPRDRPDIVDLCERVGAVAAAIDCDLGRPCTDLMPPGHQPQSKGGAAAAAAGTEPTAPPSSAGGPPQRPAPPPGRPPPPAAQPAGQEQAGGGGAGYMSSLQNRAGSLFKNIKDTSSKVVNTVQTGVGQRQLDLTYVTSRLLCVLMPEGVPESLLGPVEDNIRGTLEARHRGLYAVYNLANRHMKHSYDGRLSDVPIPPSGRPPSLNALFAISHNMLLYLKQATGHVVVLCGTQAQCALMSCALLLYTRLTPRPLTALELFVAKRNAAVELSPSVHRYLDYTCKIVTAKPNLHRQPIRVRSLTLHGVPAFNKGHTGCRPFVDVWSGGHKTHSTAPQTIEQIREYTSAESDQITIELNQEVFDDVTLQVFHARSTLGAKVKGGFAGLPMLRVCLHTAFVPVEPQHSSVVFPLGDLDEIDEPNKYPAAFRLELHYSVMPQPRPLPVGHSAPLYLNYDPKATGSRYVVTDKHEMEQLEQLIGASMVVDRSSSGNAPAASRPPPPARPRSKSPRPPPPPHPPAPSSQQPRPPPPPKQPPAPAKPPPPPTADFFGTLDWDNAPTVPASTNLTEAGSGGDVRRSPAPPTPPPHGRPPSGGGGGSRDTAEAYERMAGIRVGRSDSPVEPEPEYIDPLARRQQPPPPAPTAADTAVDNLLGDFNDLSAPSQEEEPAAPAAASGGGDSDFLADFLSAEPPLTNKPSKTATPNPTPVASSAALDDMFGEPDEFTAGAAAAPTATTTTDGPNLLQDWSETLFDTVSKSSSATSMSRNQSNSTFNSSNMQQQRGSQQQQPSAKKPFDPFGDLGSLSSSSSASNLQSQDRQTKPSSNTVGRSATNSPNPSQWLPKSTAAPQKTGSAGQSLNQQQPHHSSGRSTPNYSASNFADLANPKGAGGYAPKKVSANAFDDILSQQGFTAAAREQKQATLGSLRRDDEVREMDPNQIKIRDWTKGKERNIRALIGSLHDVVWDEARDKWEPVAMSQLLSAAQVKKYYRKACLLVHPDKQSGEPHEQLSKAIFTELNDAWNDYEEAGCPSF